MIPDLSFDLLAKYLAGPAFDKLDKDVDQSERKVGRLKTAFSGFGKTAVKGIAAIGGAMATWGAGRIFQGVIDSADEMAKASKKIGVPIEELSRLQYAAKLSGVEFAGLQTAVGALSRNISSVYLTSLQPKGSPSDHSTPWRSFTVMSVKSSLYS